MDCRWVATLLLAGCFSDPPAVSEGSSGGEDGTSSTGTAATMSTTAAASSSSSSGPGSVETSSSSSSSTGEAADSSSTGPDLACRDGATCLMPPPPEWSGPVMARISEPGELAPDCPPDTTEVWDAGHDPAAPCDCAACGDHDIVCNADLDAGANGFCDGAGAAGTGCQPLVAEVVGQLWVDFDISYSAGACTPPTPGTPLFRRRAVACAPQDAACEDGGTCIAGPACIWQQGEHLCPDPFSERTVLYDDVEAQELSCESCQCGEGSTFCDEATLTLYGEAECGGDSVATPALYGSSMCASYEDPENFVLIEDIASVNIEPSPPDCGSAFDTVPAAGEFALSGPRTLCCTP